MIIKNMVRTTLVVDSSTREKLKKFGGKGDSYEDIILRLMDSYEGKTKK
jgi:hypothetical protein